MKAGTTYDTVLARDAGLSGALRHLRVGQRSGIRGRSVGHTRGGRSNVAMAGDDSVVDIERGRHRRSGLARRWVRRGETAGETRVEGSERRRCDGCRRSAARAGQGVRRGQGGTVSTSLATSRVVHWTHDGGWTWLGRRGHGEARERGTLSSTSTRLSRDNCTAHLPSRLLVLLFQSRPSPHLILGIIQLGLTLRRGESEDLEKILLS